MGHRQGRSARPTSALLVFEKVAPAVGSCWLCVLFFLVASFLLQVPSLLCSFLVLLSSVQGLKTPALRLLSIQKHIYICIDWGVAA